VAVCAISMLPADYSWNVKRNQVFSAAQLLNHLRLSATKHDLRFTNAIGFYRRSSAAT